MSQEDKKWSEKIKPEVNKSEPENLNDISDVNLQNEIASLKAKQESLLRALADAENVRNRTIKDKDIAVKYALSSVVKDLALVLDNFTLSTKSVKSEDLNHAPLKHFYDAINITLNEFTKMLEKNGVRKIYPENEKFNPHEHEAVSQVKMDGKDSGIVVQVLSTGYAIEDRIIKPAMVVVSE